MQWYANAFMAMSNMETDFDDNMQVTAHTVTYVPDRILNSYVSDLTNEVAAGLGYATGGVNVGAVTRTKTAANSWSVQRAASTAYALGDVVRPVSTNGFIYRATTAGTTGASLPTYPTVLGQTVVDGGVTWECYGVGIVVWTWTTPPSWSAATFVFRSLVLSDRTTGVAGTSPLIAVSTYASDQTASGSTFTVNAHASLGILHVALQ
jgi:hypothetical protein